MNFFKKKRVLIKFFVFLFLLLPISNLNISNKFTIEAIAATDYTTYSNLFKSLFPGKNPGDPGFLTEGQWNNLGDQEKGDLMEALKLKKDENEANIAGIESAKEAARKLKEKEDSGREAQGYCLEPSEDYTFFPDIYIVNCIEQLMYYIMVGISYVVGFFGLLFNIVFDFTVVKMKDSIDNLGVLEAAWVAFRDLANIFFIFMLLYIAIQIILQTGQEVKHTLSKLFIVAIFLNFSLFFTKIIIDIPNSIAVSIFNKTEIGNGEGSGGSGLGDAFMRAFQFQTLYKDPKGNLGSFGVGVKPISVNEDAALAFAASENTFSTFIMGSFMLGTAAIVFLAVCIIFVKRFIVLISLMATSPLAFVGMIHPKTAHMAGEKWWSRLFSNAFYPVIFMMFIWITIKIISAPAFRSAIEGTVGDKGLGVTIFSFMFIIGFLIMSLKVADEMHVEGGEMAAKLGGEVSRAMIGGAIGGTIGAIGVNTVGRLSSTLLNKVPKVGGNLKRIAVSGELFEAEEGKKLGKFKKGLNFITRKTGVLKQTARLGKATLDAGQKSSFKFGIGSDGHGGHGDDHGGFAGKKHNEEEHLKEYMEDNHNDPAALAKIIKMYNNQGVSRTMRQIIDHEIHGLSNEKQVELMYALTADTRKKEDAEVLNQKTKITGAENDVRAGKITKEQGDKIIEEANKKISEIKEKPDKERFKDDPYFYSINRYFTGGHHGTGRRAAEQVQIQDQLTVNKVFTFHKDKLNEIVHDIEKKINKDRELAEEEIKLRASGDIVNADAKAKKRAELRLGDETEKINHFMSTLTEKQRTTLLSESNKSTQETIASLANHAVELQKMQDQSGVKINIDSSPIESMLKQQFKTFSATESAVRNGSTADSLKSVLADIAYEKRGLQNMFNEYTNKPKLKEDPEWQKAFKLSLANTNIPTHFIDSSGKKVERSIDDVLKDYDISMSKQNQTFVKAKDVMERSMEAGDRLERQESVLANKSETKEQKKNNEIQENNYIDAGGFESNQAATDARRNEVERARRIRESRNRSTPPPPPPPTPTP